MKTYWLSIVSALAAATMVSSAVHADELADIKARKSIICGLTVVQPFAYYKPDTREIVGYEVDLCGLLAKDLGVKMEYQVLSADVRVPALTQGRVDVLDALISYTKERAQVIDFSNQYVADGFYFIVRKDSGITKVDDLADKRISVAKGSLYQVAAERKFPDADVISYDDGPLAFLALQQGKVDATIQRAAAAVGLQQRAPAGSPETMLLDPPLLRQGSGFGIRKGEDQFKAYLNGFLDRMEASGDAQKLWDKWLGKDSDYKFARTFKVGEAMN